jgi:hypothetical protein
MVETRNHRNCGKNILLRIRPYNLNNFTMKTEGMKKNFVSLGQNHKTD